MEIFTQQGLAFLARWAHFLAGITWIGILYYFNFVQVPAFAEMEAGARSEALRKITWRALWWFRWGAVLTVASGLTILGFNEQFDADYLSSVAGTSILTGSALGIIMFANVWGVIWPAQKIAIGSAVTVAGGGQADPRAGAAGRRGLVASRTNTLFSISLLFFMAFTSHLAGAAHFSADPESGRLVTWWVVFGVIAAAIELNALGVFGGLGPRINTRPLDSIRNVLISGFVLIAVLYGLFEVLFKA
ncbi:MAG: antitermination protein NusG [Dehalococcoidia bacterium]|nr:antitermination protein NusG [Dehalococcoidia bacterium]